MIFSPQPIEERTPSYSIDLQYARLADVEEVRFKHHELVEEWELEELSA